MSAAQQRTGLGIDIHPRDPTRPLFLGGVEFPQEPGLSGHSDADVVCHAIADALLGVSGLGDLGDHFPESDPAIAGIAGVDLLGQVVALTADAGVTPIACDVAVIAERPKLAPHRAQMQERIAAVLGIQPAEVSIKATRPEGLGLTGDGAGCLALVTVEK